jgi:hypothetical protein
MIKGLSIELTMGMGLTSNKKIATVTAQVRRQ